MIPMALERERFAPDPRCDHKHNPNVGPGSYDMETHTRLAYRVHDHPTSTRGYVLGARTEPRFRAKSAHTTPCPTEYQRPDRRPVVPARQPFLVGSDRFPVRRKEMAEVVPGAGTYEHGVPRNRKIQWQTAFGGPPLGLPPVPVLSTVARNTHKLTTTAQHRKYHRKLGYLKLYF